MENNDFDNIPEKFQEVQDPFAASPQTMHNNQPPESEPEMSVGGWLLTIFLCFIPCVNLIMLIIWAASKENKTRSNFAKAGLIFMGISFVLSIFFSFALAGAMASLMNTMMW